MCATADIAGAIVWMGCKPFLNALVVVGARRGGFPWCVVLFGVVGHAPVLSFGGVWCVGFVCVVWCCVVMCGVVFVWV